MITETEETEDLYRILGIERGATPEEIKVAYKRRAAETHPDKNGGQSAEFLKVSKAYQILSDSKTKLTYDTTGKARENSASNLRVQAIREVQSLLLQLLDGSDDSIFYADLPAKVLGIIHANIEQSKNNIAATRKRIARLRRYKKRFRFNAKEPSKQDIVTIGINAQVHACKGSIGAEIDKVAIFKEMLQVLADYEYEPEIRHAFAAAMPN